VILDPFKINKYPNQNLEMRISLSQNQNLVRLWKNQR
jgi:hypothetical protein